MVLRAIRSSEVSKGEGIPSLWLFKLDDLDFLELVEAILNANLYFLGSVGFVRLEIKVHADFTHLHFLEETDVDEMGLLAV